MMVQAPPTTASLFWFYYSNIPTYEHSNLIRENIFINLIFCRHIGKCDGRHACPQSRSRVCGRNGPPRSGRAERARREDRDSRTGNQAAVRRAQQDFRTW